jgi:membrane protease YdiL (CAAX protease family)
MLSEKPWKLEAVLRLLLGVFICVFIGGVLAAWVDGFKRKTTVESIWPAIIMMLSVEGGVLVLARHLLRKHQTRWKEAFGFTNNWKRALLLGVITAILFLPMGWALQIGSAKLMEQFNLQPTEQQAVQTLGAAESWLDHAVLAVFVIALAPAAEEILFRGILYPVVKQSGYPRLALWGVSIFFAAVHCNVATFVPLFALALLLTLLYEKTNNLLTTITAHALFNGLNLALYYFG